MNQQPVPLIRPEVSKPYKLESPDLYLPPRQEPIDLELNAYVDMANQLSWEERDNLGVVRM